MSKNCVIGIDVGGTKINSVILDFKGNVLGKYKILTKAYKGYKAVLDRILFVIDEILDKCNKSIDDVKSIGIGVPGPLDRKKGIILNTPNLPFKNFNIVNPIKEKYNIPVILDNDANVATLGEYTFAGRKKYRNLIYITVSTGIGAGAIVDGKLYRGSTANALEIGHMTIVPNGPKCNCGNCGCLEALASGSSMEKLAYKLVAEKSDTTLKKYKKLTTYEIFYEAEKGDEISNRIINEAFRYLGIGISNIITIFNPEAIVIGGGIVNIGERLFNIVNQEVKKRCFKNLYSNCIIMPSKLGGDEGAIGAAELALMEF